MRRLLTFDGGGIRGLFSVACLQALEERLGGPAHAVVDTVAGTSIGAGLACAVAAGVPTTEVRARLLSAGPVLFRRRWPWGGLLRPKYDPAPLRAVLRALFGDRRFGTLSIRTLVPVYDVARQDALVLDSTRAAHGALTIVDVVCASAAAPTYFPAVPLRVANRALVCVDGGVAANNPALLAYLTDADVHGPEAVVVAFGTGHRCVAVSAAVAARAGALHWLRHDVVGMLLAGPSDLTDEACRRVVPAGRYFRVQTPLLLASDALDDASPGNLVNLVREATDYVANRGGDLTLDLAAEALLSASRVAA